MGRWFLDRPDDYLGVQKLLQEHYPSLRTHIKSDHVFIRGMLPIVVDGKEIDRFQIKIWVPDDYPKDYPTVSETAGRLPKIDDRHFNGDGTACLFLKDESYKHYSSKSTIIDFIDVCVKSFFLWQIEYDLTGGMPTRKARAHGVLGTIEFYKEELGVESVAEIIKFLDYHTSKKVKGHWICYCGSGKELRRCHLDELKDLRLKIPRDYALNSLAAVKYHGTKGG